MKTDKGDLTVTPDAQGATAASNEPAAASVSIRPESGALRVWWIPQVPMTRHFMVSVDSVAEGRKLLDTLAQYDDFQYRNRIKPDYCNAGGLSVYEDGEWVDWYDEDGNDIDSPEVRTQEPQSKYLELIYAVCTKHPGESRHDTALRYILEREERSTSDGRIAAGAAAVPESVETQVKHEEAQTK